MEEKDKKVLVRLLEVYKEHLWDDCNPESNNLPYELALLEIEDIINYLIREISS